MAVPRAPGCRIGGLHLFWYMSFCCLVGAAWRVQASYRAEEDSTDRGLDTVGARVGSRQARFGGTEGVLGWRLRGEARVLPGGLSCGPDEEGWGALLVSRPGGAHFLP
ncbi:hypothetical protein NDU88_003079 [Pleurodeles waltl]|uniref:Uncharacterized protein n=1 Tax=Pleurodeles waltl TaxID=8319 RepID=A0AAV7L316_PLEWA|nr:hypothetical protein NDU88_003079 [Pleurodeles waltl]